MNLLAAKLGLLALGQAADGGAGAPDAAAVQVQSVWDFIVKGGPVMIPIIACSLLALTLIVERLVSLRRVNIIPPAFLPGLKLALQEGENPRGRALEYCRAHPSPVSRIFQAGIKKLGQPLDTVEKYIQEAGERESIQLRKHMRLLSVIGGVSPLLGLLGTITGLISAFQTVATSGDALGKTELLAAGIYEAMITTAAGLLVAIPVLLVFHWLSGRIDQRVSEVDALTVDFLEEFIIPHAGGTIVAQRTQAAPAPAAATTQAPASSFAASASAGGNGDGAAAPSRASHAEPAAAAS